MLPAHLSRRACDMTSSQRFHRMELIMALNGPSGLPPSGETPPISGLGSWEEWGRFMLEELRTLRRGVQALEQQHMNTRIDLAVLKTKAAFFGAVAGVIGAALVEWVMGTMKGGK